MYVTGYSNGIARHLVPELSALPCLLFSLVSLTEKKQLLAIGGITNDNGVVEFSNKVFLWDEKYNNYK